MKRWVKNFISQFEVENHTESDTANIEISDEKANVLFIIDTLGKYLLDIEGQPTKKTRETLDNLGKEIIKSDGQRLEKIFFRFRQFYSSHRISEYTYIQKTFDDFRNIIWDFVEQLNEDLENEQAETELQASFEQLKDAVEANSIDALKEQSRHFIDNYVEFQYRKDQKKTESIDRFQKNLKTIKKQLVEANQSMRLDHLTKAFNRKSFDEHIRKQWQLSRVSDMPVTLIALDIDHFKKVNDTYGHPIGDAILIECVSMLQEVFCRDFDFVARVGGEEFTVVMTETNLTKALDIADKALETIRKAVYVHENKKIQFTISMGIAPYKKGESVEEWMKRADDALYYSKENGRDRYTVAGTEKIDKVS